MNRGGLPSPSSWVSEEDVCRTLLMREIGFDDVPERREEFTSWLYG